MSTAQPSLARSIARWTMWSLIVLLLLLIAGFIALVWHNKTLRKDPRIAVCCVLDMVDGDVELTPLGDSVTFFDLDGDDFAELTGWLAPDETILVQDIDGDGRVAGAGELLGGGPQEVQAYLARLDGNRDGFVDAGDPAFANLKAWHDVDGDGAVSGEELQSLAEAGLQRVGTTLVEVADGEMATGHRMLATGTAVGADGTTRSFLAVALMHNQQQSRYIGPVPDVPEVASLPNLPGSGDVPDLHTAMSLDPALIEAVKAVLRADIGSGADVEDAIVGVLLRWAHADTVDPHTRGPNIDARMLATLERFAGVPFVQIGNRPNPAPNAANLIKKSWWSLLHGMRLRLLVQGPLAPYFPGVRYDTERHLFSGPLNFEATIALMAADAPTDGARAMRYWRTMLLSLRQVGLESGVEEDDLPDLLDRAAAASGLQADAETILQRVSAN